MAQYTQAALVSDNKRLAAPASVDSIPSSAMQEDHVSMGWSAGRKLRTSLDNLRRIIAIELVAGCRALELRAPLLPAPATAAVLALLRTTVRRPRTRSIPRPRARRGRGSHPRRPAGGRARPRSPGPCSDVRDRPAPAPAPVPHGDPAAPSSEVAVRWSAYMTLQRTATGRGPPASATSLCGRHEGSRGGRPCQSMRTQAKAELMDRVVAHARDRLGDQAARREPFLRQYFDRVDPDDLLGRSVVDVYGAAMAHWQLASSAGRARPRSASTRPDFDQHGWQSPAHRGRDRHRRHAVPGRLRHHGAQPPRLRDPRGHPSRGHGPSGMAQVSCWRWLKTCRRRHRHRRRRRRPAQRPPEAFIHAEVGRLSEPALLKELADDLARRAGRRPAGGRGLAGHEGQGGRDDRGARRRPAAGQRGGPGRDARRCSSGWPTTTSRFSVRATTSCVAEDGEDVLRWVPGSRLWASCATPRRRRGHAGAGADTKLSAESRRQAREPGLLTLTKANSRATVHRPSHLDYVGVKRFDASGTVVGERRFLGLYTASRLQRQLPSTSRWSAARWRRSCAGPSSPRPAMARRTSSRCSRPTPATSSSRPPRTSCSTSPWASSRSRSASRSGSSCEPTRTAASCPAWSTCPRSGTRRRAASGCRRSCSRRFGGDSFDYTTYLSESALARMHFIVYTEPRRPVGLRRPPAGDQAGRGDPVVGRGSPRRPDRPVRRGRGRPAPPPVPRRLSCRLPRRLRAALGGGRYPQDRGADRRGRPRDAPLPSDRSPRRAVAFQAVAPGPVGVAVRHPARCSSTWA